MFGVSATADSGVSNMYVVKRCVWFRQKKQFGLMYASKSSGETVLA